MILLKRLFLVSILFLCFWPIHATAQSTIALFELGKTTANDALRVMVSERLKADGRFEVTPWSDVVAQIQAQIDAHAIAATRRKNLMEQSARLVIEGDKLLEAFDGPRAGQKWQLALEKARLGFSNNEDIQNIVTLHQKRALLYAAVGATRRVETELRAILCVQPKFSLDPAVARPSMMAALKRARKAQLEHASLGAVIVSEPSGARVMFDGRDMGRTPVTLPAVAAGVHYVTVNMQGHLLWSKSVALSADRSETLKAQLVYIPGAGIERLQNELKTVADIKRKMGSIEDASKDFSTSMVLFYGPSGSGVRREMALQIWDRRRHLLSEIQSGANAMAMRGRIDELLGTLQSDGLRPESQVVVTRVVERVLGKELKPIVPWYKNAWVWTGVGAVVVGGIAAALLTIEQRQDAPPGFQVSGVLR